MKLSDQAVAALMLALQKSLLEQTDIVPVLKSFEFQKTSDTKRWGTKTGQLEVANPPEICGANIKVADTSTEN